MRPLPRLRKRRRGWALLALPALLLRALIPVGFMPVATAAGLSIEFCPDAGAHAHHHHHPGGPDQPSATHRAPCLYAASATLASAPDATAVAAAAAPARAIDVADVATLTFVPSILRAQSPRAPPLPAR